MLKAIGGWRARADVRYRLRAARARRGQTAKVYLLTSMLAMSLFGADAEFSQARPVERANFIQFRDVVLLPLSGPSAASYQYAPNADDGGGLKVAITQITPSGAAGAARITCDARLNGYPCGALNGWLKGSPQAWLGFSPSAVIDCSAHKDVPPASLVNATASAAERDAISDLSLLDTADVIIGRASMYDPHDADDRDAGGIETASGELYDPVAWTAAIQIDLRGAFGGIHYGRNYRPAFALVEGCGKRAVGTRPNLHPELSSQIRRRPTIIRYTAICSPLDNSLRERRQSACFGGFHMGALQYYALCAETMTFSKRFMTGRPSFKTRLEAIMKLALEYLEDAIKFERLAALEENPEHKSALMGQAAAYRKLAEERAKKIGVSLPNKLD